MGHALIDSDDLLLRRLIQRLLLLLLLLLLLSLLKHGLLLCHELLVQELLLVHGHLHLRRWWLLRLLRHLIRHQCDLVLHKKTLAL